VVIDSAGYDLPLGVAVLGAGAIGSVLGARLLRARVPVTLIGRPGAMEAVRERGLTYEQPYHRAQTLRDVEAVSDWSELGPFELANVGLVVLTTKAFDTEAAIAGLARHVPERVPLLVLQNGVGGVALARQHAGARPLLAGVTTLVATCPQPGVVRSLGRHGGLGLATVTAPLELLSWTAQLLALTGLPIRLYRDHEAMAWSKLLLNLLGNAVPAIVDLPPRRVFADLALCRLEVAAFREALAVMRARRQAPADLPGWRVSLVSRAMGRLPLPVLHRALPRLVGGGRAGKEPSLQLDLRRGRQKSEVEYLNGAVARAGLELGVAVPANALIFRTLSLMVQGAIPRDAYAANPHSLLAPLR
jgi:2-dehydropantoate 2-reductase